MLLLRYCLAAMGATRRLLPHHLDELLLDGPNKGKVKERARTRMADKSPSQQTSKTPCRTLPCNANGRVCNQACAASAA